MGTERGEGSGEWGNVSSPHSPLPTPLPPPLESRVQAHVEAPPRVGTDAARHVESDEAIQEAPADAGAADRAALAESAARARPPEIVEQHGAEEVAIETELGAAEPERVAHLALGRRRGEVAAHGLQPADVEAALRRQRAERGAGGAGHRRGEPPDAVRHGR